MTKAKDPAVLWYYRDYLQGTEEMSWSEQGAYSRLLNKQADKGHLSMDAIRKVLKKDFEKLWPGIAEKFLVDEQGDYYNERMDMEVAKRRRNSQNQRDRINAYWESVRNNDGNTTEYSTEKPIANANANKENNGASQAKHIGLIPDMVHAFRKFFPDYPADTENDYPSCMAIAKKIALAKGWTDVEMLQERRQELLAEWETVVLFASADDWYSKQSISMLNKKWQDLIQAKNRQKDTTPQIPKTGADVAEQIRRARQKHNS